MTLDPTARESNVRDSIKKFFIDTFETANDVRVTFDITVNEPPLRDNSITRWLSVAFSDMLFDKFSTVDLDIYCVTRKDPEGFRLAQLRDLVYGNLVDTDQTDGMKRIAFYRSYPNQAWEQIGALLVYDIQESGQMRTDENGKAKILSVTLKFASKL